MHFLLMKHFVSSHKVCGLFEEPLFKSINSTKEVLSCDRNVWSWSKDVLNLQSLRAEEVENGRNNILPLLQTIPQ